MVGEVVTDPREVDDDVDAVAAQRVGLSDAGELQQVRRSDRSGTEDDLAGGIGGAKLAVQ